MKFIFKFTMAIHIFLYRLTRGKFGAQIRGFKVLLLTTTGRKSGKERTTPLGYFDYQGNYVVAASNAGLPNNPGWYFNLKSNPKVNIQVREKELTAEAEITEGELRNQLWKQLVEEAPDYANYENNTDRIIPMVVLRKLSD